MVEQEKNFDLRRYELSFLPTLLDGNKVKQLTKEQAINLYDSGEWKDWTYEEIARFQLFQDRLCMPFAIFHEAIEKTLGRPVCTHEFGMNRSGLEAELIGENDPPTFEEIINMIPEEKLIIIFKE